MKIPFLRQETGIRGGIFLGRPFIQFFPDKTYVVSYFCLFPWRMGYGWNIGKISAYFVQKIEQTRGGDLS
jgi:hypothetical protein